LNLKFPAQIPADLVAAVQEQADLNVLTEWLDRAVLTSSIEDVQSLIRPGR
jgi:hypothetical protein